MNRLEFAARDTSDTVRLGSVLAAHLPEPTVIVLSGTLGAGKTRLVQAVAAASGIAPETVLSPTFTLCHEYHGERTIFHFDAYRLRDEDEFDALGPEEYFQAPALTFIEWGERVARSLPAERLEIQIHVGAGDERIFELQSRGARLERALTTIADELGITPTASGD